MAFQANQKPKPQKTNGKAGAKQPEAKKPKIPEEGQLSTGLKIGYWYVRNKPFLKKVLMALIIVVVAAPWTYSLIWVLDWAFITGPKERANLNTILDVRITDEAIQGIEAQDIVFSEAGIFAGGVGKYDLFSQVLNPNDRWQAEFEYRFVGEGYEGEWIEGFVLPNDDKYVTELGVESPFRPRNIRLETRNFEYTRVDPHDIENYNQWKNERLNVLISDKTFDAQAAGPGRDLAVLKFNAQNDTPYDYWAIGFYAYLYRGDQLVSINYLSAQEFLSGQKRELQMQFTEGLPTISRTEIVPDLNIFDESVYIK